MRRQGSRQFYRVWCVRHVDVLVLAVVVLLLLLMLLLLLLSVLRLREASASNGSRRCFIPYALECLLYAPNFPVLQTCRV